MQLARDSLDLNAIGTELQHRGQRSYHAETTSPFAQRISRGEVRLGDGSQSLVDGYEVTRDEASDADGTISDKPADSRISFVKKSNNVVGQD